jgi:hypothetical protein
MIEIKYIHMDIGVVVIHKPVLLIDDTENSRIAIEILENNSVEFVEYHIRKFEEIALWTYRPLGLQHYLHLKVYLGISKALKNISLLKKKLRQVNPVRVLTGNLHRKWDDNDYGFVKLTINSNALSGRFISQGGRILDSFSLVK